jgi:sugar lactone lactonase YvrE
VIHRIALTFAGTAGGIAAAALVMAPAAGAQSTSAAPFITHFHTTTTIASTVPGNGDVNPYGVAVIGQSTGNLHRGDVLVSNFNNSTNAQGTGTTIVEVSPHGTVTQFAGINAAKLPGACPGGVGLTTALDVLNGGWVVVGSLPTSDGTSATAKAGCLIVLDSHGNVRETISGHGINGPWDMAAISSGHSAELFVTNVLNGTVAANGAVVKQGTVLRLTLSLSGNQPSLTSVTTIGSGFGERTDPAALVVGPTGVDLDSHGTLFVADSVGNRITAIPGAPWRSGSAGIGHVVTSGGALNTPLGLAVAPNGDVLTVNAADGFIVETTPGGKQVATKLLDSSVPSPQTTPPTPPGAGALFGLAVAPYGAGVYYVDDATNTFALLH